MLEYPFDYIEDYYETHNISKALLICSNNYELTKMIKGLDELNHSITTLYDINNKFYRILGVTIEDYKIHKSDLISLLKDEFNLVIIGNVNDNDFDIIMWDLENEQLNILNLY